MQTIVSDKRSYESCWMVTSFGVERKSLRGCIRTVMELNGLFVVLCYEFGRKTDNCSKRLGGKSCAQSRMTERGCQIWGITNRTHTNDALSVQRTKSRQTCGDGLVACSIRRDSISIG